MKASTGKMTLNVAIRLCGGKIAARKLGDHKFDVLCYFIKKRKSNLEA